MKKFFKNKIFIVYLCIFLATVLLCASFVIIANALMLSSVKDDIISAEGASALQDVDCILVLGCLVRSDGTPSDMLTDRLLTGMELYFSRGETKLLMSGDHGQEEYDEVNAMRSFAISHGVPSEDIFMDHAGFSTYESMYRAKEIFGVDKIIIVTQGYHLSRALYIAKSLGIEAFGVESDIRTYRGQTVRDVREILARSKDFLYSLFKPLPTHLGEPISLEGDGNVTADKNN